MVVINKNKSGFTLVELLIVMAILISLAIMLIGAFNPIANVNKARDATRKKDLNRIKIAFEEYNNDKGSYPGKSVLDDLSDDNNCGSSIFTPWLVIWPCDPNENHYVIFIESDRGGTFLESPSWFKIITNLENKEDSDIPSGWYEYGDVFHLGSLGINDVNYGVSSPNVNWYDAQLDPSCEMDLLDHSNDFCYIKDAEGCKGAPGNVCNEDQKCYARRDCSDICKVKCCGVSCNLRY